MIKDEVDYVAMDVFHDGVKQVVDMVNNVVEVSVKDVGDVVEQDADDMVKNVDEDVIKEVGDVLDVEEENQHKWEHWPSPASSQEMGLQCTKKDWSFFCTLKRQSIKKGWPFFFGSSIQKVSVSIMETEQQR